MTAEECAGIQAFPRVEHATDQVRYFRPHGARLAKYRGGAVMDLPRQKQQHLAGLQEKRSHPRDRLHKESSHIGSVVSKVIPLSTICPISDRPIRARCAHALRVLAVGRHLCGSVKDGDGSSDARGLGVLLRVS